MSGFDEYSGIYTLLLTPFKADKSIDYKVYEEYVSWQAAMKPQHLFAVCGSSEMTALTPDERAECARLAVKNSGGVPVYVTANLQESFEDQVREMDTLTSKGVSGLVFVTKGMCDRPEEQYEYLMSLAEKTELPIILYEFPGMRPHLMQAAVYGRLVESGRFKGIKDTTCKIEMIGEKIAVQGNSSVLQANIPYLYDAFEIGARGVVATPTTCGNDLFVKIWDEWVRGDKAAAKKTYHQIINLDNAIDSGFNASAKYICKLRGIGMEPYTRGGAELSSARMRSLEAYVEWAKSEEIFR